LAYAIGVAPRTITYLLKAERTLLLGRNGAKNKKEKKQISFVKNKLYRDLAVSLEESENLRKDNMYKTMRIPKKRPGEFRILHDPHSLLKHVQRLLLDRLLGKLELPEYVTGFMKDVSITDTAKVHTNKEVVCCMDIQDFFPSIKEYMIRECMLSYGWPENVARMISEICTYHNFVPQGAPTSPTISNLIGYHRFDKQVKTLADQNDFTYSRYADDLVFSTNRTDTKHTGEIDNFLHQIEQVIQRSGFKISPDKTKIMRKGNAQMVLGQSVPNAEPTLPGKKYYLLRAIVHNCMTQGIEEQAKKSGMNPQAFIRSIKGHLNFLKNVDPKKHAKIYPQFETALFTFDPSLTSSVHINKDWAKIKAPVDPSNSAERTSG
jgi:retron-type reverse transcriptase